MSELDGSNEELTWSENDFYFSNGIRWLLKQKVIHPSFEDCFFINLNGFTLKKFNDDIMHIKYRKIVIISTAALMPLAYFWFINNNRVIAIFETGNLINDIEKSLLSLSMGEKFLVSNYQSSIRLSASEVILLKLHLEEEKLSSIKYILNCSNKVLYNRMRALAKKFRVRKLGHLLIKS